MKISDKAISDLKNGLVSTNDFANELMEKFTCKDIALTLAEVIALNETVTEKAITVTQSEYDRICSLFRIQGSSNRGRKPKKAKE